jgi:predicted DNA-binding transcriptional regulator YafY
VYEAQRENGTGRSVREVDPASLTRLASDWYLAGYCYLRGAMRVFRLSRIADLVVLGERVAESGAEHLGWAEALGRAQRFALVEVDASMVARLHESPAVAVVDEQPAEGGVQVTLLTHAGHDLVPWLLGWGPAARVLEPPELRAAVVAQARALLARYLEEPADG